MATIDDLMRVEGKAELIGGAIVRFAPLGLSPSRAKLEIAVSLHEHAGAIGRGYAFAGGLGYEIPILRSGRESFCPDASYYVGQLPADRMRFIEGPPTFAVEIHGEDDYGPAAERERTAKRADYFEAGTLFVWDVDPKADTIRCYPGSESSMAEFARGEIADAEPAVPGWRIALDTIFG